MVTTVSKMILDVFANVSAWFQTIMSASGGIGFWLGCFLIWQVTSKLLMPAVGGRGRGSDIARKSAKPNSSQSTRNKQ